MALNLLWISQQMVGDVDSIITVLAVEFAPHSQ